MMMGSAKVGKSSIISQFLFDKYLKRHQATVEELHRGEYKLPGGASLTLDILDTTGTYQFPAMRALHIAQMKSFILVFAVDDVDSWDEVVRLREQVRVAHYLKFSHYFCFAIISINIHVCHLSHFGQIVTARGFDASIVVVGNKIDVPYNERKVKFEMAEAIAIDHWKCGYVECSAKENEQIIEVFKEVLVQSKIRYDLGPAVQRRRQSLQSYASTENGRNKNGKYSHQRHSCAIS